MSTPSTSINIAGSASNMSLQLDEITVTATRPTSTQSVLQYPRKLSIVVGTAIGQGIEFAAFKVTFQVRRGDLETPNSADVRIYNLSDDTANQIASTEYTQLAIQAGYEGNFGLIFYGTIVQARKGRLNGLDNYVDLTALDGDAAYNYSFCNFSLAKGSNDQTALQAMFGTMASAGIQAGNIANATPNNNGRLRGRVFYGPTRSELRDLAIRQDQLWSIQDGQLTFIPQTAYLPGDTPLISAKTGLIGTPEQTQQGVVIRVLLNPSLRIGRAIKLDAVINRLRYGIGQSDQVPNEKRVQTTAKLNASSLYYVMRADHTGDSRGNEWYTDLTCLAIDASVPYPLPSGSSINTDLGPIKRLP